MSNIINSRKQAINIILISNAILLGLLDTFIPIPLPIPGAKIGLANIITIIAICFLSYKDVMFIVVLRCVSLAFFTRGIVSLVFSLSAGLFSASIMWFLYKKTKNIFSIKGLSMVGAIVHSIVQITVASIIMKENIIFYYFPVLLILAIITGLINGSIGEITINEIRKRDIIKT